jgi:hypothetical protein
MIRTLAHDNPAMIGLVDSPDKPDGSWVVMTKPRRDSQYVKSYMTQQQHVPSSLSVGGRVVVFGAIVVGAGVLAGKKT